MSGGQKDGGAGGEASMGGCWAFALFGQEESVVGSLLSSREMLWDGWRECSIWVKQSGGRAGGGWSNLKLVHMQSRSTFTYFSVNTFYR